MGRKSPREPIPRSPKERHGPHETPAGGRYAVKSEISVRFPDWVSSVPMPFRAISSVSVASQRSVLTWRKENGERSTENWQKSIKANRGTPRNANWRALRHRIRPRLPAYPFLLFSSPRPSSIRQVPRVPALTNHPARVEGIAKGWLGGTITGQEITTGHIEATRATISRAPDLESTFLPVSPCFALLAPAHIPPNQYPASRRFRNAPAWMGGEKRETSSRKMGRKSPRRTNWMARRQTTFSSIIPFGSSRVPRSSPIRPIPGASADSERPLSVGRAVRGSEAFQKNANCRQFAGVTP